MQGNSCWQGPPAGRRAGSSSGCHGTPDPAALQGGRAPAGGTSPPPAPMQPATLCPCRLNSAALPTLPSQGALVYSIMDNSTVQQKIDQLQHHPGGRSKAGLVGRGPGAGRGLLQRSLAGPGIGVTPQPACSAQLGAACSTRATMLAAADACRWPSVGSRPTLPSTPGHARPAPPPLRKLSPLPPPSSHQPLPYSAPSAPLQPWRWLSQTTR